MGGVFILDYKSDVLDISYLGKNIKIERKKKAIKQNVLAKQIGISNTYLSDIERQKTIPSLTTYIKICKVLNVDLEYILKKH
ncbi:MAG: helix-turn-helix transcriptional regulator [Clostridiales bacterium]|nr:helix-turn-helix transcriptional regulator [Clostridiales bacterium]